MSGPTKHMSLPVAAGFGLEPGGGSSGGGRPESVTTDQGTAARRADMASSKPEPKDDAVEYVTAEAAEPAAPESQVTAPAAQVYEGQDDIDALHARFDSMEAYIKRSLTVATLHARFDALETYLKSRFGD